MKKIIYLSGKEYEELAVKAIELDKIVYDKKYVGSKSFYEEAHSVSPDNFIFAFDVEDNSLAGYLLTTPLDEKVYNEMKKGREIDTEFIKNEDILPIEKNKLNHIYIYSLVVSPKYQGYGISKKMIDLFIRKLENKIHDGFKIKSILADTINSKAFNNISRYNFVPIGVSNHKSVLAEKTYTSNMKIQLKQTHSITI